MEKLKALITAEFSQEGMDRLSKYMDIEKHDWFEDIHGAFTTEQMIEMGKDKDIIICEISPLPREVLEACPNLKLVVCCRGLRGDDPTMDVEYCNGHSIPILNAPGRNTNSVAEMVLFLTMGIFRRYQEIHNWFDNGGWVRPHEFIYTWRTREVKGKTVGIIGFGNIGKRISELFNKLEANVLAYDAFITDPEVYKSYNVTQVGMDELLQTADVVIIQMNVTEKNKGLIGARELGLMKKDAVLVNAARAVLVDRDALYAALESHSIGGFATDVLHNEPANPENEPLTSFENVFFMPHIGGTTRDVAVNHSRIVADDIDRLFSGESPKFCMNPDTLTAFWEALGIK